MESKIVALGDSITYGYPYNPDISWVNHLKKSGIEIINRGINGDTLEGMLERFDRDVVEYYPKFVIIMGGTNDAFGSYSLAAMEYNLKQIVYKSTQFSIKPIIGIPVPTDELAAEQKLSKFRCFLKDFCIKNDIMYIDFYSVVVDNIGRIKPEFDFDGVHPNIDGHKAMAKIAGEVIKEILEKYNKKNIKR